MHHKHTVPSTVAISASKKNALLSQRFQSSERDTKYLINVDLVS